MHPQVTEMESEAGVAGALHGALAAGSLATTFTSSQGLLLMIPNMYKISGELMPCVLHVAARALAQHALSIFGDHQDAMAVRQTGWSMISSCSVQEAQDLALVSHLATLAGSVPIVHFFDGFRTSHEINKVEVIEPEDIRPLLDELAPAIAAHHARALNPAHPHQRGTAQGPDVYMQALEAANPYHMAMPGIVQAAMDKVAAVTGRQYRLFDYVGHPEAENVTVAMGSGCEVLESAVKNLTAEGKKVGLLKVRLFRPWSAEHMLAALPKSVKRIAVMDRTKEHGSGAEPLLLDVATTLQRKRRHVDCVVGGRYGLASKDFTPAMALAVYENLMQPRIEDVRDNFCIGIVDDVTFTSLSYGAEPETLPEGITECKFWGMGSDGTVGANKEAVKIIASQEGMFAQAYFSYDAHKSGGVTVSHLRFGPKPIHAPFLVDMAHYIGVHQEVYFSKFDTLAGLRPGGTVLVNAKWKSFEEMEKHMHPMTRSRIAQLRPKLYCLDAGAVAEEVGLGRRVNMVMQSAFFALSGVMSMDKAIPLLKESIKKAYGKKGDKIVNMNWAAVDKALERLVPIEIPAGWGKDEARVGAADHMAATTGSRTAAEFLNNVVRPMLAMEGDKLPVSVFPPGGVFPPGTTDIEKRSIATRVPEWDSTNCTQCNICSFVCPHAAIRPVLATPEELVGAPAGFQAVPIKGGGPALKGMQYRIQVSPMDCTGCDLCVHACPDKCLTGKPLATMQQQESPNWDFYRSLPARGDLFSKETVRGSQFQQPLMEFSGACEGCGETPYVKLLTQVGGPWLRVSMCGE
jgi:pyruvate-ferredoxin/flavodoxin oxidoreductase